MAALVSLEGYHVQNCRAGNRFRPLAAPGSRISSRPVPVGGYDASEDERNRSARLGNAS